MDSLAPSLSLILTLRFHLLGGDPIRTAIHDYLEQDNGDFSVNVAELLRAFDLGKDLNGIIKRPKSSYRRSILELVKRGLAGESILEELNELEKEVRWACDQELDGFFQVLPVKTMLPVLLLQMPAYLILLFGPIMEQFLDRLSQ